MFTLLIHKKTLRIILLWIFTVPGTIVYSQTDESHFSKVFNREKPYRIFLPDDYFTSQKRYPVIYYFHGNTGDNKLDIPGVKELVNANSMILVAWNGRSVDTDLRPYNIGNHSNINYQTQFKDYFPELVNHIDHKFRTIPDRTGRAIIGHSMGGFMAIFIAGKYPDMVSAVFESKGSPEFFVGNPAVHTLYHVRYMFKNLLGVKLGFATSGECELFYLNNEVIKGALREEGLDYTYKVYEGGHSITPEQFRDAFNFVVSALKNPAPEPKRWNHADLYPNFNIWGYEVKSNLNKSGYIEMKGVTKGGFEIGTKSWEPDGRSIPDVLLQIKTAPVYLPNNQYSLLDYNEFTGKKKITPLNSDSTGRIFYSVNSENHQIGIFRKNDPPELALTAYKVNDKGLFLEHKKECDLKLQFINRGGSISNDIKIKISTSTEGVVISNPVIEIRQLSSGELVWLPADFKVTASNLPTKDGTPFRVRFNLNITDNKQNSWQEEFDAPVMYDVPEFTNIGIDDGDSEIFGSGNGDNIADPGETLMIYEITNGSHRLRLYYDDSYVDNERLYDEIQPDKWGDGYSLSSLIHISKDCPIGHQIKFLACYEIKDWKKIRRDVTWGTFTITVGPSQLLKK